MVVGRLLSVTLALFYFQQCDGWHTWHVHRPCSVGALCSLSLKLSESCVNQATPPLLPTTMLLNVSYDGGRFTGWSAQNEDQEVANMNSTRQPELSVRARRRSKEPRGMVRSVEGVLRFNLARIFGDIDPERIIIESCSRTDKGVHAQSMICQIYCLSEEYNSDDLSIPGKRIPHPRSSHDSSCFVPIPKDSATLMDILNKMCTDDVKIRGVMKTPTKKEGLPFHPTLDCTGKTYEYSFSVGPIQDPLVWRRTWHLENTDTFDIDAVLLACKALEGTHNFVAFRGAPRGKDDKRRQERESTICTLDKVELRSESQESRFPELDSPLIRYTVVVKGDRFLYKMVRFIAGVLAAVGTHKISNKSLVSALECGTWDTHGNFQCAPPGGLVLKDVQFDETIKLDWDTIM